MMMTMAEDVLQGKVLNVMGVPRNSAYTMSQINKILIISTFVFIFRVL